MSSATMEHLTRSVSIATSRPYLRVRVCECVRESVSVSESVSERECVSDIYGVRERVSE